MVVPEQLLHILQTVWADPLPNGVQTFDKTKRRRHVAGIGDIAGWIDFGKRSITDGDRDDPTLTIFIVVISPFDFGRLRLAGFGIDLCDGDRSPVETR